MKNIFFGIIAGIENAFNPKNKKKFIINIILLVGCIFLIIGFNTKRSNNQQKISNIQNDQFNIKNQSSVIKKVQNEYAKNQSIIKNDTNKDAVSKAEQTNTYINAAQDCSYTVVSPGQFQLDKLNCLCDQNMSNNDKNKILDEYCYFQPGETIWLFKNWICNIVGMNQNNFSTGFDINDSILYIYANLNDQQKDYLTNMINMIWTHSAQKYRSNDLQIEFLNR